MHRSIAFNAKADRINPDKNAGKWKERKKKTLGPNDPQK
tara:strand:- start:2007 stop:2123 length:117 start_codon:yes stop_codon:yes gene_type:complete